MFRALLRLVIVLVVLVCVGAFFLGWWGSGRVVPIDRPLAGVGTAGHVDTQKAKEVGAEVGAKTAQAANKASAPTSQRQSWPCHHAAAPSANPIRASDACILVPFA